MSNKTIAKANSRPTLGFRQTVDAANSHIEEFLISLKPSLPFDSRLAGKDYVTCVSSLVSSRFLKKFNVKSDTETDLRSVAMMAFQDYEVKLAERMSHYSMSDNPLLFTVRRRLLSMCKTFSMDYTDEDVDVGPGETYQSSNGHTQMIAKLSDLSHWTTTPNCLEDTYTLIYFNRSLKRVAKQHIGHVTRKERAELYNLHREHPNPGYAVFCDLLDRILTVVPGSKGASVPKNNDTDRFINIEPFFPMLLQRYVAKALLRVLKSAGYALDGNFPKGFTGFIGDRQLIHKRMIAQSKYSTIDFSNASDSVCLNVIRSLFPQKIVSLLEKFRSHSVRIDDQEFELFKLSSMGNGFTFEVMTLLLLSACRVFTDDCSVFGDDVIIPNDYAKEFLSLAEDLGFRINNKKTFINSNFRESCGSFYHDDYGYLTSFDFRRCEVYNDVVITHNKICLILQSHGFDLPGYMLISLLNLRDKLAEAPLSRKGPLPSTRNLALENLGNYFFDGRRILYKHMRNESVSLRYKLWVGKIQPILHDLQLSRHCVESNDWILVTGMEFKAERSTRVRTALQQNVVRLHTMRPVVETVRGKGYWRDTLILVEVSTGRSIRVSALILDSKKRKGFKPNVPISTVNGCHNEHVICYRSHMVRQHRFQMMSGAG